MDERAFAAGTDAFEFRLRHLDDPLAGVPEGGRRSLRLAASHTAFARRQRPGVGVAQYEDTETYGATMVELAVV